MNKRECLAWLLLAAFAAAPSASAQIAHWTARGTVYEILSTGSPATWTDGVGVGDTFELTFKLDHASRVLDEPAGFAEYISFEASVHLGTLTFDLEETYPFSVAYNPDAMAAGSWYYVGGMDRQTGTEFGMHLWYNGIFFDLTAPEEFNSQLPEIEWDFDIARDMWAYWSNSEGEWYAGALVDSVEAVLAPAAVPEPAAYAWGAVAVLGAVAALRRRQTKSARHARPGDAA